ncbi:hypothetical protein FWD07_02775 [Candidatus Saccharibacteria bacterium]|nr:hypothetical protein [Candidatus Saccharibacteria bacterium]
MIFTDRKTVREIKGPDGNDLNPASIFVVKPYDEGYSSGKTSTLLVNKKLKDEYDKIWANIKALEAELLKSLVKSSGRKDADEEVSEVFTGTSGKFLDSVQRVKGEVNDGKAAIFSGASYKILFDEKVAKILGDIQPELTDYIARYNDLVDQSKYFRRGVFNHTNAATIADTLVKNGFFDASHAVTLSGGGGKSEITSQDELKTVIEGELQEILKDEKLRKAFDKIDKKLTGNQQVKDFRDYITEHQEYIAELASTNHFKQKIWIDYFKAHLAEYNNLVKAHDDAKTELDKIRNQANKERTRWADVVDIFNLRFNVPFVLSVDNQSDVILDGILPSLSFEFKDETSQKTIKREELLQVLSVGERKALYILNILFEVEARKDLGEETLMIVDDIADSFDYKNKYAIIEYLKDISEISGFYQIVLTHNFDFFRTIQSRYIPRDYCLMVDKSAGGVSLVKADYVKNPFKHFLETLSTVTNDAMLLSLIPFMRNIVEYTEGEKSANFCTLTSVLHIKDTTPTVQVKNIKEMVKNVFDKDIKVGDENKNVADLFIEVADTMVKNTKSLSLECKIVLSVAIRLKSEQFMIDKIADPEFLKSITGNQTAALSDKYLEGETAADCIGTIKRVNLITPQNIHLNSFMYEPILDMSDEELKTLYKDVVSLK